MAGKIFINYRRADSKAISHRIYGELCKQFGNEAVFIDVDNIPPGADFRSHIVRQVCASAVLLAVIGPKWLELVRARAPNPEDWVRVEIETALQQHIPVIPILIDDTRMPLAADLPRSLEEITFKHAPSVSVGADFSHHMERLVQSLFKDYGLKPVNGGSKPLGIWLALWEDIKTSTNRDDFLNFLNSGPPKDLAQLAEKSLDGLDWKLVAANRSIQYFEWFLQWHPNGKHSAEARSGLEQLQTEAWLEEEERRRHAQQRQEIERQAAERRRAQASAAAITEIAPRRSRVTRRSVLAGLSLGTGALAFSYLAFGPGKTPASSSASSPTQSTTPQVPDQSAHSFTGHTGPVNSVAFSPNGRTLASGSTNMVKLWDVTKGRELRTLGHADAVSPVAFSPDGRTLASGSLDKTVKLWDVAGGRELRTLAGHRLSVMSIAFSPDGRTLASGSGDAFSFLSSSPVNTVKLWEVAGGREMRTLTGYEDSVTSVAFSPDGRMLASGSGQMQVADGIVKLWDVAGGRELRTLTSHNTYTVHSVAFSPDGRTLASCSVSIIKLWDVMGGRELRTLTSHNTYTVHSVAFSPDGQTLASGSADHTVKLWDVAGGRELRTFTGHAGTVHSVAFSPDGRTLASGSDDQTVKLWDVSPYLAAR